MARYLNLKHLLDYLDALRRNRKKNDSPYMDNAMLNLRQLIETDNWNPILFDWVEIGRCEKCRWRGRHQKCSCCRRNRKMKDCFEEE